MSEEIVAALSDVGAEEFGIWPENWPVVEAFLSIDTQWRTVPLASGAVYWAGLDYTAVAAGLNFAGRTLTPAQWSGLQLMEAAARGALNGVRG
ncbi:uncharacterized protein DUF1799 [Hephaestia caeni]|uniref:Uncharacterized protein DUF1799 n=1 Tax=Hephaestia caeni TaxID=645617 RepID=A0A397P470_9SPHN|nr:DUF1799 domain-containing protein [Hephaestia caeni]RIA44042.1 uncharacterized protein DUF1799 [Hephaestia caeni]